MRRWAATLAAATLAGTLLSITACGGGHSGDGSDADQMPAQATGDIWTWALPAHFSPPPVPADNPMTRAKFALGRALFHDVRLSGPGIQSCASCHRQEQAFTDGLPLSRGATGELTPRNSQPLANAAWQRSFTWSRNDVRTLEQQAEIPLFGTHPIEIGITDANRDTVLLRLRNDSALMALFRAAVPGDADPVTLPNIVNALATYQRGLVSADSLFDRVLQGRATLDAGAERGRQLFFGQRARCAECHVSDQIGRPFEPAPFHNTGLYNLDSRGAYPAASPGLIEQTGLDADMGRFRVPSLRNVAVTAPYLHDGSAATLAGVLSIYAAGGRVITSGPNAGDGRLNPFKSPLVKAIGDAGLTAQDLADLEAFLRSLTDDGFLRDPRLGPPLIGERSRMSRVQAARASACSRGFSVALARAMASSSAAVDAPVDAVPKPMTSNNAAAGLFDKRDFVYDDKADQYRCPAGSIAIHRMTSEETGKIQHKYWSSDCPRCPMKPRCTTGKERRISRWEHEDILDVVQKRLEGAPEAMRVRRQTVEHVFGTLKGWMGPNHFLTKTLPRVATEMSLQVLAYNLKRVIKILGTGTLIKAMTA